MRKYILYMVGLVLSVATVGCVKTDDPSANQSGMVTLQLSNGTLTTRAVGTNDNTNNEDLIVDAQVFFFDSDASSATVKYSYYTDITDVKETASISIPLTTEQLTSLFPSGNGYVYVIANYGSEITGATTLAALKAKAIASTFGTDEDGVQPSFIMDSNLTTVARGTANNITGEVFLTRAAAKVELTVNVAPITQDGKQWIADTANMRLSFNNGVSNGVIDDDSDEGATPASNGTTFDIDGRGFTRVTGAAGNGSFVQSVPFYSYSTKWTTGAENEVYLELAIPWAVKTEGDAEPTYQTFYYQVPVSADALTLVRNAYYKLTLDVGVLGGLTKPVTVEPSYVVVDWGTNNVNVTLSRPKYLVVDENKVTMNNITSYSVGYQSSDAVTAYMISFKCTYHYDSNPADNNMGTTTNVSETWNVSEKVTSYSDVVPLMNGANYKFTVSWDEATKQVTLNHDLDNEMADKVYHHFPYEVTVRVTNTETGFYEDIVFVQFPALYVTPNLMTTSTVFINGHTSGNSGHWYYVRNGSSKTKSLLTVTISAFDADTERYKICDPREPSNNDNFVFRDGNNSTSRVVTTATDASQDNTLTGYRATISGDDAEDLVAPQFMFSSSYISNGTNTFQSYTASATGKYRCAAYQEYGYPAGRWRLPTPAELEIMGKLCAEGKVETLFYHNATYMSSNGPYLFNGNNGTFTKSNETTSNTIRCVYDTWYWKDKCAIDKFIWGAEGDIANGAKSQYLVPVE